MDNNIEIANLKDEISCLKLELEALSEELLYHKSERLVPNFCSPILEHDHRERYVLASRYTENQDVLDMACGTGYGTFYLATEGKAKSVVGCDLDPKAIMYASHRYKVDNISYYQGDAEQFDMNKTFDVVTSFETIEHLNDVPSFLNNLKHLLKPNGTLIISTPISHLEHDSKPANIYHVQEWGFYAFQKLIGQYFEIEDIYTQLYQFPIINAQIWDQFYKDRGRTTYDKMKIRLKKILRGQYDSPQLQNDWSDKKNYSKIEKYSGIPDINDLGKRYPGYQVIVCKNTNI